MSRRSTTIARLLDLADDFGAFCRVVDALARTVPLLFEEGDPALAMDVIRRLARGDLAASKPWPELQAHMMRALEEACGARTMSAVLARFECGEQAVEYAKELVSLGGEKAALGLADAVMTSEDEATMSCAQEILGRRLPEILAQRVALVETRNAGRLAALFAVDGGASSLQALQQLAWHPEDRIRTETARAVCAGASEPLARFAPQLLRDPVREVAMVAARALGRRGDDQAVRLLAARLVEFDDDKELMQAREIIGALAASPSEAAGTALKRFSESGSFLKKRKSAEMRQLAKKAVQAREAGRVVGWAHSR